MPKPRASDSVYYDGYWRSPAGVERRRARLRRRVRMCAGGEQFFLGYVPSDEVAERLRRRIKEEAPK